MRVTYSEYGTMIHELQSMVNFEVDCVIGLKRGGLVPAVALSHSTKTPLLIADVTHPDSTGDNKENHSNEVPDVSGYENILIVDDIIDSGYSIYELVKKLPGKHIHIHVMSLFATDRGISLLDSCHDILTITFNKKHEENAPFVWFPWEYL